VWAALGAPRGARHPSLGLGPDGQARWAAEATEESWDAEAAAGAAVAARLDVEAAVAGPLHAVVEGAASGLQGAQHVEIGAAVVVVVVVVAGAVEVVAVAGCPGGAAVVAAAATVVSVAGAALLEMEAAGLVGAASFEASAEAAEAWHLAPDAVVVAAPAVAVGIAVAVAEKTAAVAVAAGTAAADAACTVAVAFAAVAAAGPVATVAWAQPHNCCLHLRLPSKTTPPRQVLGPWGRGLRSYCEKGSDSGRNQATKGGWCRG